MSLFSEWNKREEFGEKNTKVDMGRGDRRLLFCEWRCFWMASQQLFNTFSALVIEALIPEGREIRHTLETKIVEYYKN